MCGADDHWVNAAMADDTIVVDLLLRLHGAPTKNQIIKPPAAVPLPLWTVRQRRSRAASSANNNQRKQAPIASPATPLSWSGGATSVSGGSGGSGGGDEESSRPPLQDLSAATRSKVNGDVEKTALKRSRKKKTLAELKDEERSLLKERKNLKRDIAALRLNLEEQKIMNENLKRRKIELQPVPDSREPTVPEESISDQLQQKTTFPSNNAVSQFEQEPLRQSDSKFVLPDLNIPFDDKLCPESTCGVR